MAYNRKALRYYSIRSDLNLGRGDLEKVSNHCKMFKNIADCRLWDDIEDLLEILKKIHECQIMSKSSDANLGFVVQRWYDIKNYLKILQNQLRFACTAEIDIIFQPCINKNKRHYPSV